ncbi:sodium:solute symporter [Fulvivirga kasyanovii]|uniref:Sodium:solute symporter n=1 Tax=Fulvivirga kasyanovii TaxID=396812 RepID=A0ABW9RJ47_9BACT|nr:sodium:solute symporter [Fulvivirga kasyanovii]MTI23711.1 sodium:solute symporter [Fulvivirga kasyanovii]
MTPTLVITVIAVYFALLITISFTTTRRSDSSTFFTANRQSPWYLVAFGMIGASLSGVTFISVPGWVADTQFSYMQMVLGYLLGYLVIATVLMPLYYRLNLISIYGYLEQRFGFWSYKTGAFYFLLSRVIGSSFRLFLVAGVLQIFLFDAWNVDFSITVLVTIVLIWLYTFRGGIKTIVWTDTLQTLFMLSAVGIVIYLISQDLKLSLGDIPAVISESEYSQIFFWDWQTGKNFFKQFFAGAFIAIVMTGLDQDMMQKNLTCKNLGDAQKNMFWFSVILVFANLFFLSMGALLYMYANSNGIPLPERTDDLFPMLARDHFNIIAGIVFLLGIVAAAYSSADSALTALTTSFCVDFLNFKEHETTLELQHKQRNTRLIVHLGFSAVMFLVILLFKEINNEAVISAVFTAAGYTYGPLLGLYSFGLFTKLQVRDYGVPIVCLLSPALSYWLNNNSEELLNGYKFGFEILIVNGGTTFLGLLLLYKKRSRP